MKLAYTRIVTEDVDALGAFYERLTGTAPVGMKDYVELRLPGAYLAICSRGSAEYMHGGEWKGGTNRSVIVEFDGTLLRVLCLARKAQAYHSLQAAGPLSST